MIVGLVAIDAYAHAFLSVGIVLYRSSAIVLALRHIVRQLHEHAEAEEVVRLLAFCHLKGFGDFHHASIRHDEIGHRQVGFQLWQGVGGTDAEGVRLLVLRCREGFQSQLRLLPQLELLLQTSAHVVVGGSSPEVGFQGSALAQERLALTGKGRDESRGAAYLQGEVGSDDSQVGFALPVDEFCLHVLAGWGACLF